MNDIDPNITDRLAKLTNELFVSKAAFARAVGTTPSYMWSVGNDPQSIVKSLGRIGLADERIDLNWLLRGKSLASSSLVQKELERENEFLRDEIRFLREQVLKRLGDLEK